MKTFFSDSNIQFLVSMVGSCVLPLPLSYILVKIKMVKKPSAGFLATCLPFAIAGIILSWKVFHHFLPIQKEFIGSDMLGI